MPADPNWRATRIVTVFEVRPDDPVMDDFRMRVAFLLRGSNREGVERDGRRVLAHGLQHLYHSFREFPEYLWLMLDSDFRRPELLLDGHVFAGSDHRGWAGRWAGRGADGRARVTMNHELVDVCSI